MRYSAVKVYDRTNWGKENVKLIDMLKKYQTKMGPGKGFTDKSQGAPMQGGYQQKMMSGGNGGGFL